jgi:hypothetical protein
MYRTAIALTVLSESPLEAMDLEDLAGVVRECNQGDYVGDVAFGNSEKLSGKEMADALYAAGSEPGFFMLDDDGNSDIDV